MKIDLTPEEVEAILDHLAFSYSALCQDKATLKLYGLAEDSPEVSKALELLFQALELSRRLTTLRKETK